MKISNAPTQAITITCPACGLLCDDIVLNPETHVPANMSCPKSIHFFEQAYAINTDTSPSVAGKPTNISTAIKAAADILHASKQPLFAGLGTEVQGIRTVLRLAEKVGATLDHMHNEGGIRNTLTLQNSGWQNTTLMEVKNRADVILAIGTDIVSSHPRFFEKLVWNEHSMFDKPSPEIIYLCAPANTPAENFNAGISPEGKAPTIITADTAHLPEIINALNALINNKKIKTEQVAGVATATLQNVLDKLKTAKYAVITWGAGNFKYANAELTIQGITQIVSKLNETSRAAGLPLNAGDGDMSVNNVSTWLSSYPTRNRFTQGKAEYNPHFFSTKKQLESCDGLLWISTFNAHLPPHTNSTIPTIVIGHPNMKFDRMPDVFIPVGIPGVDHIGTMLRMDNVVSLPLKKSRETTLPSLSQVIQQILDCMS
jgi:formylmethanofuran dehydrogenase subunit B